MKNDYSHFIKKLEEEKKKIEEELSIISRKNPANPDDWEAIPPRDIDEREPDLNEAADNVEDYEESFSLNGVLEERLNDIKKALEKVKEGKYGLCNVGGEEHEIETERLEANPAATTCMQHLEV